MKKDRVSTPVKYIVNAAVVLALYLVLNALIGSGVIGRYYAKIINLACVYIVAAVSLNLTCGFLGQLPLGHAGFMAIGAYTSALITKAVVLPGGENVTFFVALLAGGLLAAVFGVLIGLPALRLKGDYLAIITLGFGEIIRVVIQNLSFTGGAMGLQGIPRYTSFSWCFFWVAVTIFVTFTLIRSRQGRAILSIREDEIAAESCGIPTTYFKTLAFTVAAFFGGISGGLLAHHVAFIGPSDFNFMASIEILVMVVLGGMGSIAGSVIAAGALTVLPELLRAFSDWRMVIYSVLLVVVMIFKPSGLMGHREFSLGKAMDGALGALRRSRKEEGTHND
ncbi:MAG: branched-chain amino acid ABC transporter permease [Oscillospiraceae bacterium]|nr:branched-chain amino acid ABC transporter permease [Oscillospiraceae bacterium]